MHRCILLASAALAAIFPAPATPAATAPAAPATLVPGQFQYLGAFRLPGPGDGPDSWAFGGRALTYVPGGDPGGAADGFPGSLFGGGHAHHQRVSEIAIPAPVVPASHDAAGFAQLPVAQTLQAFADLTGGIRAQVGVDHFGDLAWLPARPGLDGDRLYWTIYEYYNVAGLNFPGHGWSRLDLSAPAAAGAWYLGPPGDPVFHSMRTARYLFDAPQDWADLHLAGRSLLSGRHREAGCCGGSRGPALFASAPWRDGVPPGSAPPPGGHLAAQALVWYPEGGDHFPDYRACDDWSGGVFASHPDGAAVILVGRKSLGEERYGLGRPGDCAHGIQGYHCDPYESQFLFYAPADLAAVAAGALHPWQVLPRAVLRPAEQFWPGCHKLLGGAAHDRERSLLYVVQAEAFEGQPIIHVFRIAGADRLFADGFEAGGPAAAGH